MLPNTVPDTAPAPPPIYSEPAPDSDAKTTTADSEGAIETAETVDSPTGTDPIDPAPKGPVNLGPLPNPNLNLPKTNTVTIPNMNDTSLNLQPSGPPNSITTTGSGGKATWNTKPDGGTTSGGTKPGTTSGGTPGGGTTSGGTKPGTTSGGTTGGGTTGGGTTSGGTKPGTTSTSK